MNIISGVLPGGDFVSEQQQPTGSHQFIGQQKTVTLPMDQFNITIRLTSNNEFIAIDKIEINKSFLSQKQKIGSFGVHDVDEFYR